MFQITHPYTPIKCVHHVIFTSKRSNRKQGDFKQYFTL